MTTIFVHGFNSWRRIKLYAVRGVLTCVACSIAWIVALISFGKTAALGAEIEQVGRFNGLPAYRLSIKNTSELSGRKTLQAIPFFIVDDLRKQHKSYFLQLRHETFVRKSDQSIAIAAYPILFHVDTAVAPGLREFPPCFLRGFPAEWDLRSDLVRVGVDWRCSPRMIPGDLDIVHREGASRAIILPMASLLSIFGEYSASDIAYMWVGSATVPSLSASVRKENPQLVAQLEVTRVGSQLQEQLNALRKGSVIWLASGVSCAIFSVFLFILCSRAMLLRELRLRMCLGASFFHLCRWLVADVFFQAGLIMSITQSAALLSYRIHFDRLDMSVFRLMLWMDVFAFGAILIAATWIVRNKFSIAKRRD